MFREKLLRTEQKYIKNSRLRPKEGALKFIYTPQVNLKKKKKQKKKNIRTAFYAPLETAPKEDGGYFCVFCFFINLFVCYLTNKKGETIKKKTNKRRCK